MHIEKGHFDTVIKNKDGTERLVKKRVEISQILREFPIITYYQPAKNVMNNLDHVFGISAATFVSIMPYVYDEQKEALTDTEFGKLKYLTLAEMKTTLKNVIDGVIELHKPQQLRAFTCEVCHKTFCNKSHTYNYNNMKICKNCKDIFNNNRYTKRPPKRQTS